MVGYVPLTLLYAGSNEFEEGDRITVPIDKPFSEEVFHKGPVCKLIYARLPYLQNLRSSRQETHEALRRIIRTGQLVDFVYLHEKLQCNTLKPLNVRAPLLRALQVEPLGDVSNKPIQQVLIG